MSAWAASEAAWRPWRRQMRSAAAVEAGGEAGVEAGVEAVVEAAGPLGGRGASGKSASGVGEGLGSGSGVEVRWASGWGGPSGWGGARSCEAMVWRASSSASCACASAYGESVLALTGGSRALLRAKPATRSGWAASCAAASRLGEGEGEG